jgi:hypothetical protein
MNATYSTRIAGLAVAVLMTFAINGTMLLGFDAVAKDATSAQQSATVALKTVNIVGHRS